MCYAIPGKIISINNHVATIDYFGEHKTALIDENEVDIGDYVYAQGGVVIDKIEKKEALALLKKWKKKFFELKKIDETLIKKKKEYKNSEFSAILKKAKDGRILTNSEILKLLKTNEKSKLEQLYSLANELRKEHLKNSCCVHGIIEFSNFCAMNCHYCGLRNDNKTVKRYRMNVDEIVACAEHAVNKLGFKALVLQSGEDYYYTTEMLCEIVKRIKEKCRTLIFVSIGERSFDCYKKLYEVGARGALLRFETSNKNIYKIIRPGRNLEDRVNMIKKLNEFGYIVATGFLIGLPGEREQDIINNILLTRSLKPEMYSFGPFIPHPQTPLANATKPDLHTVLKAIALSRLLDNNAKILVTTALETLDKKNGKRLGLLAGANSLMIDVTPRKYKKLYEIYPNKAGNEKSLEMNIKETIDLLYSLGRAPTDLGV